MNKPIIYLAVAGAGKTYQICHSLDKGKRNLILSYTNENILNINRELNSRFGAVPSKTIVQTYDSFLLNFFVWPYYKMIQTELFHKPYFPEKHISFLQYRYDPSKRWENSKTNFSKYFVIKNNFYIIKNCNISTLILQESLKFSDGKTLFEKGMNRINNFFDCLYIDEFQDYRNDKHNLMVKIIQNVCNGFLYGDFYQHSVSGDNNSGKPFSKNINYKTFIKQMEKKGFEVNNVSLLATRRCSENVCEFIRNNLMIEIYSDKSMGRNGKLIFLNNSEEVKQVLLNGNIKIISLKSEKTFQSISFGLSKGNTYKDTMVVIPDKYFDAKNKCISKIDSEIIKNKIYVGLTRATGNTYITSRKIMEEYINSKNC